MRNSLIVVLGVAMLSLAPLHAEDADPYIQSAAGMTVHFGMAPAGAGGGDGSMHGGPPDGIGMQHVMVALFDAQTGARVSNAHVTAYLAGVGRARSERVLEPMPINGAMTYGNYFSLPGRGPFEIRVEVRRPGQDAPARVSFVATPAAGR